MKLLIVEDDPALAVGLRSGLLDAGFALDLVHRLDDAERSQQVNQYDLIVLDLGLPDGDGREFLAHLRERGIATPAVILTARAMVVDRVDGLNSGADDDIQKPFAFPGLVARIRALLRRPASVIPPVLRLGDLEFDSGRFAVRGNNAPIKLTVKETALIEDLLR